MSSAPRSTRRRGSRRRRAARAARASKSTPRRAPISNSTRTLSGERAGSLLATIDLTATPAGARLIAERLASPLTDPHEIDERLDALAFLVEAPALREALRKTLRRDAGFPARAVAAQPRPRRPARSRRLARRTGRQRCDRANARSRPKPCRAALLRCCARLARRRRRPGARSRRRRSPTTCRSTSATAASCAPARSPPLDEARRLRDESRRVVAEMQARYAEESGDAPAQDQAQQFPRLSTSRRRRRRARRC